MTPAKRAEIREPCRHSASLRAFTPVFDGLWRRVTALTARRRRTRVNALTAHPRYAHQETDLAPLRGALFLRSDNELLEMVPHRRQQRHRRRLDQLGGGPGALHGQRFRARDD